MFEKPELTVHARWPDRGFPIASSLDFQRSLSLGFPFLDLVSRYLSNVLTTKLSVKPSHFGDVLSVGRGFLVRLGPGDVLDGEGVKFERLEFLPDVEILVLCDLRLPLGDHRLGGLP